LIDERVAGGLADAEPVSQLENACVDQLGGRSLSIDELWKAAKPASSAC
jgi:hypothetical protein